jgi:hypothetical protein
LLLPNEFDTNATVTGSDELGRIVAGHLNSDKSTEDSWWPLTRASTSTNASQPEFSILGPIF